MQQTKKLLLLGLLSLFAVFMVACSGDDGSESETNDTGSDNASDESASESEGEEVTIVYATGVDTTGKVQAQIEEFMELHPNITVDYREMPSDTGQQHDQYVTMFSSQSSEIDVFNGDVIWPAEFAQANYALELDRFIEADGFDLEAHFDGPIQAGNFNGRQWALPLYIDASFLYYRTDITDTPPATWDELIEQAEALQGEGDTQFGYITQASQYEGLVTNFVEIIASYGGAVVDENNEVVVNSPETIKGLEKLAEIVQSDFVPGNILNFQEIETENAWIAGDSVFARNWPYMQSSSSDEERSSVVDNVDIAPLPAGDEGSSSALGGWMAMINRYTEHPEESWELVKYLAGEEGQKTGAIVGNHAPTIESLYDDPEVQEAAPLFQNPQFVEGLSAAVPRPVSPIYPEISDIIQIEVSQVLTGEQTAEQAAENMQSKMEAAMAE
ncbi:ABC transporter substrate-binding protein [Gracilibacillus alcaliphilus]|uniref:ABC transporter substrate-binding protein n=1 Tax=Gracilibacillus alcaliphilus TaxID=1401441 RepID=UPI00195BFC0E|nr:ABC transporter substrate-binding protein [Gracilibacillus alcaliphilus]MBM7676572.1 multiple sugar transport system substrate-binding protein [Gracilibacillus alcaliphilus]